jgi:hypothetical protein
MASLIGKHIPALLSQTQQTPAGIMDLIKNKRISRIK